MQIFVLHPHSFSFFCYNLSIFFTYLYSRFFTCIEMYHKTLNTTLPRAGCAATRAGLSRPKKSLHINS